MGLLNALNLAWRPRRESLEVFKALHAGPPNIKCQGVRRLAPVSLT